MKRLFLAIALVSLALIPMPTVAKAQKCVVVIVTEQSGNCLTETRTICCDGPNSCVVVTTVTCY